jgi:hypothetical protein
MNFNASTIIIAVVILFGIPYLITVLKKLMTHGLPLDKALNPFYKRERLQPNEYRQSLSPIIDEIETKRVANFIKYWADKFENDRLTVEDVKDLNVKIAEGASDQVNGILAIHPEGRKMFDQINESLKLKEKGLVTAEETEADVLVS